MNGKDGDTKASGEDTNAEDEDGTRIHLLEVLMARVRVRSDSGVKAAEAKRMISSISSQILILILSMILIQILILILSMILSMILSPILSLILSL